MSTTAALLAFGEQHTTNSLAGCGQAYTARPDDPDRALVLAVKNGDRAAFDELVNRHERAVYRLAQNITRDASDAEEVLKDTFLQAFRHIARFNGESKFSTWLTRIAINQALMLLRKRTKKVFSLDAPAESEDDVMPREIADWGPTPEQRYSATEIREILTETLNRLSPTLRVVFQRRDIEELSTEETARVLGISRSAVKSRLLRARLWLRERLNRYFAPRRGAAFSSDSLAMGGAL